MTDAERNGRIFGQVLLVLFSLWIICCKASWDGVLVFIGLATLKTQLVEVLGKDRP